MKEKIIALIILSLFIALLIPNASSTQLKNRTVYVHESLYDDPLSFRVQYKQIYDRIWIFRGYATNTFNEPITVRWGNKPFSIAFFYKFPDNDDKLFIGQFRTKLPHLRFSDKWFEFEPGEEKLIDSILFFGLSNRALWGFKEGYKRYINSWPILPNGIYEVRASLSPYQNENYEMLSLGVDEQFIFDYN